MPKLKDTYRPWFPPGQAVDLKDREDEYFNHFCEKYGGEDGKKRTMTIGEIADALGMSKRTAQRVMQGVSPIAGHRCYRMRDVAKQFVKSECETALKKSQRRKGAELWNCGA